MVQSVFVRGSGTASSLQVTIPIVTPPPMARRRIRADTCLQQKVPLGALVLAFSTPHGTPPKEAAAHRVLKQENASKGTVVAQSQGFNPVALDLWSMFIARTNVDARVAVLRRQLF